MLMGCCCLFYFILFLTKKPINARLFHVPTLKRANFGPMQDAPRMDRVKLGFVAGIAQKIVCT
jgi:hypothetical protein